jgi:hypothetical protein
MVRVKKIAMFYEWDEDILEELNQKKYVVGEYDYSNTHNVTTGDLLKVTFSGTQGTETFPAICSQYWRNVRKLGCGKRNYNYYKYRVLYRLTEEGQQFIQSKIVEERV